MGINSDEKIDRKSFIIDLRDLVIGAVGIVSSVYGLEPWLTSISKELVYGIDIPDDSFNTIKTLFHINSCKTSIVPASKNPNVRERLELLSKDRNVSKYEDLFRFFSRATVEASNYFKPLLLGSSSNDQIHYLPDYKSVNKVLDSDKHHTIIALGTPTSNHLVRAMMFYKELKNSRDGHQRIQSFDDIIHMPYQFELRKSVIISGEDQSNAWYRSRNPDGTISADRIPNWGLEGADNRPLLPTINPDDGTLLEDFLVISVIPNFLQIKTIEENVPVICMGGTHSIGTLAIKNLFESFNCIRDLNAAWNAKGRPKFWQAVFRVELKPSTDDVRNLHLIDIKPVEIHHNKLKKLSEKYKKMM